MVMVDLHQKKRILNIENQYYNNSALFRVIYHKNERDLDNIECEEYYKIGESKYKGGIVQSKNCDSLFVDKDDKNFIRPSIQREY